MMNEKQLRNEYASRYDSILKPLADKISAQLLDHLNQIEHIDRISSRAKGVDSFVTKAQKANEGERKYDRPFEQIQDLVAARIIVFYKQDVEVIEEIIRRNYKPVESKDLIPERESEFGYVGKHFILSIPQDLYADDADRSRMPIFFELQIKTLFQHAWSEASHDLAYKQDVQLTSLQKRMIALTAAQSWGADQQFAQLNTELKGIKLASE
jgi:putative GTP pyrophosphokinase